MRSKFEEKRSIDQFSPQEIESALGFIAAMNVREGEFILACTLYRKGRGLGPDLLDACVAFLRKYGFLVEVGRAKWLARKSFTIADVPEACEVAKLICKPRQANETVFETLRRARAEGPLPY